MDIKISKTQFIELYLNPNKTVRQIAKELNVSVNKVVRAAKSLGISKRTPSNNLIITDD